MQCCLITALCSKCYSYYVLFQHELSYTPQGTTGLTDHNSQLTTG